MDVRYANIFGFPFPHTPPQQADSFPPTYSAINDYLPPHAHPNDHCKQFHLGEMLVGKSPHGVGTVVVNEPQFVPVPAPAPFGPLPLLVPGGATVTVDAGVVAANASLSKTLYVLFDNQALLSSIGHSITAQLVFDQPNSGDPGNGWSVGLNFKTGDQNDDRADDQVVGATCHFIKGGQVKFNGTDNAAPADTTTTYAQLDQAGTQFTLTVTLNGAASDSPATATASLTYGNNPTLSGNVLPPPGGALPKLNQLKAVGLAVVMITNGTTTFGARLRAFNLSWTPPAVQCHH